ncbi:hypothetical protein Cpir12675_002354 [Ceratocystis pirilliformis]|uniref:Glutamine synthetase n=1 Tax=Ceratocystis pirilliformis TaxID=259994 RepID=A0ABR3ZA87_9PEZI
MTFTNSSKTAGIINELKYTSPPIEYLRIYWNDLSSIPRARVFPIERILDALNNKEFRVGIASAWTGLMPDDNYIGDSAAGEFDLFPDWSSLRIGPRHGHASVQGEFRNKDGSQSRLCPRSELRRVVREAEAIGLDFRIGFEMEFMILERDLSGNLTSKYQGSWSYARALDTGYARRVIEPTIKKLKESGIKVEQYHAEAASSQYEIILPHKPPTEAIDNLLHAREVLHATALSEGLVVTFHPKFDSAKCGSGSHVHLSLCQLNNNKSAYESFYAGILSELPTLLAFTYSSPASYLRMRDFYWAGGSTVAWGKQDKEAALRVIEDSHWEMKTMDGMANPYLALTAILTAGRLGYMQKMKLSMDECTTNDVIKQSPIAANNDLDESRRPLPRSLKDALGILKESSLKDSLSPSLIQHYIKVKEAEIAMYEKMDEDEMREFICCRY